MSVFDSITKVVGQVAPIIEQFAERKLEQLATDLLVTALVLWRDTNFRRFNDLEVNCTVQVYNHALRARAAESRFQPLNVMLEYSQPSQAMLNGEASATEMKRPDLRISVGQRGGWSIECKRLKPSGGFSSQYVDEGILRFTSARYGSSDLVGAMIGYLQEGDPDDLVSAINARVKCHIDLDDTHTLNPLHQPEPGLYCFESCHRRKDLPVIELRHHFVDFNY